jgi:protein-S-isoprenylcysteine O-methyltransferase Ste14
MITIQQVVLAACWSIFMLYWFISATTVKPIQETRGWLGGNWYPILYLIGFLFMMNFRFLGRLGIPRDRLAILLLPHTITLNLIIVILLIAGLTVAITARHTLARNWSGAVALKADHELITTGLYQYVRHPIYTGMLLMILGTALSVATIGAAIGFLIILVGVLLKLKQEEALLTKHFAQDYLSYKKRTRTLIPFIW